MNEREIFQSAIDIPDVSARQAFLDRACGTDVALREQVERLIQAHSEASGFLQTPAAAQLSPGTDGGDDVTTMLPRGNVVPPTDPSDDAVSLEFLEPTTKPGSLGRLAHYEVMEVLGRGAFGIVLKAFDEKLHRMVAIKVMSPELAATSPPRKRFTREAQHSAKVRHDNIVAIYDVEEQPLPYLVMEYIPGGTLQQRLDQKGPLELHDILWIGQQIASGLAAAHSQGLIHRDIKPANILIEGGVEERVKITDFGLARATDDASLTQSGLIAGTPMYMSPEQAKGQPLDHRTDQFSLGSVLYTMASGRPPFRAPTTIAVLKRVCDDTPRPIPEVIPEIPQWLCDIIAKLQAKEPDDRFASTKEVADLLGQHLAHLREPATVPKPPGVTLLASKIDFAPHATRESALKQLRGPALGLILTACINWIVMILLLGFGIYMSASARGPGNIMLGFAECVLLPVLILGSTVLIWGGMRMREARSYGLCVTASLAAMLIGPGYFIGWPVGIWSLIVLSRPEVRAAFRRPSPEPPQPRAPRDVPTGVLGRAWHSWWSERDRWVVLGVQTLLILIHLGCMICFISMSGSGGHDAEGNTTFTYRLGVPTPWFQFEAYPQPHTPFRTGFNLLSTSVLLGLVGCAAYYGYWRIEKVRNPQMSRWDRPGVMLTVWGTVALLGVAFGHWQGYSAVFKAKIAAREPQPSMVKSLGTDLASTQPLPSSWQPLFNGRDLTAWKANEHWKVENGVLVSRVPAAASKTPEMLVTERSDFRDFHVRIVAKLNPGGDSGFFFRFGEQGDRALQVQMVPAPTPMGGLLRGDQTIAPGGIIVPPDTWFTLEVIARGPHIVTMVDGQLALDWTDPSKEIFMGPFAIESGFPGTEILIRSIEAKSASDQPWPFPQSPQPWQPLFNGRDLSGWKTHPQQPGNWQVENGAIVGTGDTTHLFTERDDFVNFEFRGEVRLNENGNSGVCLRTPFALTDGNPGMRSPIGYELQLVEGKDIDPKREFLSGGLIPIATPVSTNLIRAGQWHKFRIKADGDQFDSWIDDTHTVSVKDPTSQRYRGSHLALQAWAPQTRVDFRNLEVRPLWSNSTTAPTAPPLAVAPFDATQAKLYQDAWAGYLGVPVEYTNPLGMKFRLIPPGEFVMGSSQEEIRKLSRELEQAGATEFDQFVAKISGPPHKVRITQPFYFGMHEITVADFRRLAEETKYLSTMEQLGVKRFHWKGAIAEPDSERRAVIGVSWDDANAFCQWLTAQQQIASSLPTEAQWEYACRAGTTTLWSFGDDPAQLSDYAVFGRPSFWPAEVVGTKRPNPFGLFDMHGNADEWCRDWHDSDFYARSPVEDPVMLDNPKDKNSGRVARGGAAISVPWWTRSTTRPWDFPATPNNPKGFRVVLAVDDVRAALAKSTAETETAASALQPENVEQN